ncbi:MAG: plasmid mobilization relaxosome protein MobC [Lachnospiraceae bacterium]|nr:plasmid mobilization relaxosome protein MobC [Candidatus Colinaster scatohippi]
MGVNINQIAKKVNETGTIDPREIELLKKMMDSI